MACPKGRPESPRKELFLGTLANSKGKWTRNLKITATKLQTRNSALRSPKTLSARAELLRFLQLINVDGDKLKTGSLVLPKGTWNSLIRFYRMSDLRVWV